MVLQDLRKRMAENVRKAEATESVDLRIRKTYMALTDAFLKLLSQKEYNEISIGDICHEAPIRRATFYQHFEDMNDFVGFIVRRIVKDLSGTVPTEGKVDLYETALSIGERTLNFIDEKQELLRAFKHPSLLPVLKYNVFIESQKMFVDLFNKIKEQGTELPSDPIILAHFYAGAIVNVAFAWLTGEVKMSKEETAKEIYKLIDIESLKNA